MTHFSISSGDTDTAVAVEPTPAPTAVAGTDDRPMVLIHPDKARVGKRIILMGPLIRIGRDELNNNLVLPEDTVSGRHAQLERVGANWALSDVGSKNGTFVNDAQLQGTAILKTQDRIHASVPHERGTIRITISCGVARCSSADLDPKAFVGRCDSLLYSAKEAGRNRVSS